MKVLLLNDTSAYHNGCKVVVEALTKKYGVTDTVTTSVMTSGQFNGIDYSQYDLVVLNGEGSIHDSARTGMMFLSELKLAQWQGVETKLVNTVWQNMSHKFDDVLRKCTEITVREVHSFNEMLTHAIIPDIVPDCSYFVDVPIAQYDHVEIYEGQYWGESSSGKYPIINIFNDPWNEIVNKLRNAELLITGRHHEMYAACKAKCRFLIKEGNTWKNKGLLDTVDAKIPWDIEGVLAGKYDKEYQKIWDFLDESACTW